MKARIFVLLSLTAAIVSGCNENTIPEGHYTGTELNKDAKRSIERVQVSADFKKQTDSSYLLSIVEPNNALTKQLKLTPSNTYDWNLEAPFLLDQTEKLNMDGKCWDNDDGSVHLCATSSEITGDVRDEKGSEIWSLNLQFDPTQTVPVFETPKSYTLSEAMNLAATMSFDSRIEYEHVLQAKHQAKAAALNMLPHLNSADIFNNLAPSFATLAASVGDLAPFLLPTRWLQAKDAAINAQIEGDINELVQLSMMAQVEGLTYALKRDQGIVALYRYLLSRTQDAHDKVWALEQQGTFPGGSTAHMQAVIQSMQLDMTGLSDVIKADRAALSQSLGLFNPEAVIDVTFDSENLPIEKATAPDEQLDEQTEASLAVSRSIELDEMSRLSQIAVDQKTSVYFNWLDPSGDYTQDLGFNLTQDIQIASSQVKELDVMKEQMQSNIAQNLFSYVDSFNTPAQAWSETLSSVSLSEQRLNTVMTYVTPNSGLNTLDIEGILQDYLAAGIRKEETLAEFRVARTQINRALFQDAYANPVRKTQ